MWNNTTTTTGFYTAKSASGRVVQNTAEATCDSKENKIADKITSVNKGKPKDVIPFQETYISPKHKQIIGGERLINLRYIKI